MSGLVVMDTPNKVEIFRLLSMRGRVLIEKRGKEMGSGMRWRMGSMRQRMALEMGLKPRAKFEVVIAAIEAKLATLGHVVEKEGE